MQQALVIDSQIRDLVFIPLIIMVFFIGILKYAGRDLMMNRGKKDPEPLHITKSMIENTEPIEFEKIHESVEGDEPDNNAIQRSTIMRTNGHCLPAESVRKRKVYFCKHDTGYFRKEKKSNPLQAMMNPEMMTGMIKGQFFMMAYNIGMFSVTGFFFSGFVNAKMPFPLAQSFR